MRLCHLVAAMHLEEDMPARRSVPSSWSLLKAEFGFIGNRARVMRDATNAAAEGRFINDNLDDPLSGF